MADYTQEIIEECHACERNPLYFIDKYVKIQSSRGQIPLTLYPAQANCVESFGREPRVVIATQRQLGMTSVFTAYLLWYLIFNKDKTAGLVLPRLQMVHEYIRIFYEMYELLPDWMRPGIEERTKSSIRLSNNARLITSTAGSNTFKGRTINLLVWDLVGFGRYTDEECFLNEIYPCMSIPAGQIIMCGSGRPDDTPNFLTQVYLSGLVGGTFYPIQLRWWDNPSLTRKWKAKQIEVIGEEQFKWEYESIILPSRH